MSEAVQSRINEATALAADPYGGPFLINDPEAMLASAVMVTGQMGQALVVLGDYADSEALFLSPIYRAIWRACRTVADRGREVNPVTVFEQLRSDGADGAVGGADGIFSLIKGTALSYGHLAHHAQEVRTAAMKRRVEKLRDELGADLVEARTDTLPSTLGEYAAALRQIAAPAETDSPLLDIDDLRTLALETGTYIIDGVLQRGVGGVLTGASQSCKTTLAHSMLASVVAGRPWFGRQVTATDALYVCGEGLLGVPWRLAATLAELGIEYETVRGRLRVYRQPLDLTSAAGVEGLLAWLGDWRPGFIVIDTLSTCIPGVNENDAGEMSGVWDRVRRLREELGCTTLVLHHPPRGERRERGSTTTECGLDARMWVERDGNRITLTNPKQKDAEPFEPMHFEIARPPVTIGATTRTSVVLRKCDESAEVDTRPVTAADERQKVLGVVRDIGEPRRPGEIAEDPRLAEIAKVSEHLNALARRGDIHCNGREGKARRFSPEPFSEPSTNPANHPGRQADEPNQPPQDRRSGRLVGSEADGWEAA